MKAGKTRKMELVATGNRARAGALLLISMTLLLFQFANVSVKLLNTRFMDKRFREFVLSNRFVDLWISHLCVDS